MSRTRTINIKLQTSNRTIILINENICPLCERPLADPCSRHHLIPVSKGGKHTGTVLLHKICHDKIHSIITEKDLKRYYNTVERLREHEDLIKFIEWIKKKPPEFYDPSNRSSKRK